MDLDPENDTAIETIGDFFASNAFIITGALVLSSAFVAIHTVKKRRFHSKM